MMTKTLALIWFLPSLALADASIPAEQAARAGERADFDASGIRCSGRHCDIDRRLVDYALLNLSTLAAAARIVPHFVDGRATGFKLYAVKPGGIYDRLLIKNGDTLLRINGRELSSPEKCLELYSRLRSATHFVVELERHDRNLTLDYTIR